MPTRDAHAAAAVLSREGGNGNGAVVIGVESALWRSSCELQSSYVSRNSISRADTSASAVALWSSKQTFLSVRVLFLVAEASSASCKEHKDGR